MVALEPAAHPGLRSSTPNDCISDGGHTDRAGTQLRTVIDALIPAGHFHDGDLGIWVIGDRGYDGPRLAFLLADLPVQLLVRLRSDRGLAFLYHRGSPEHSGAAFATAPGSRSQTPELAGTRAHDDHRTTRYGQAYARSLGPAAPELTRTGVWTGHSGHLSTMAGTAIRLEVQRLPETGTPKLLWLWFSATATTAA